MDFTSGIAVVSLGHAHPAVVQALQEQSEKLWHISNLFEIPGQEKVAEKLIANTHFSHAFFCNSGAEANEAAIKLIYGDGEQTRDFIYVDDIADAIYAGVSARLQGTYNVSTNEAWSIHQVILLLQHLNHPLEIQYAPAREGDIEHSFLNNDKLIN